MSVNMAKNSWVERLKAPRILLCERDIVPSYLLNIYLCTKKAVQLSPLIQADFFNAIYGNHLGRAVDSALY